VDAVRTAFQALFKSDPHPTDALFWTSPQQTSDSARPLAYHCLWHRIGNIGKQAVEAGILRGSLQFTPHLFRRSYITQLYRSGMKLKALQKKSRHRSLDVLINHYIDDSESAALYLAKILEGAVEKTLLLAEQFKREAGVRIEKQQEKSIYPILSEQGSEI
jgi:hypothetical protein